MPMVTIPAPDTGPFAAYLGRVDELFDDNPCRHEMNKSQKGLAQFLISRGNAAKLFEVVEKPFHLLTEFVEVFILVERLSTMAL